MPMRGLSLTLRFPALAHPLRLPALLVPPAEAPRPAPPAATTVRDTAADPDFELTGRARQGDSEAFRELVERHRNRAFAVARRIVRSDADAEEVAQDAFVRAWRALPDFRGDARFSTWLHAIVVRRALDRAEVLSRRRGREQALDEAHTTAVATRGPDPEALRRSRRLDALMGELTTAQRAAVTLFYHEDQSVERVAEVLNVPVNTVKTHLSRARAVLREAWVRSEGSS